MLKIFAEFKYSLPSLNLHIAYLLQTDKGTQHAIKTTKVKIVGAKPIFSVVHAGNRVMAFMENVSFTASVDRLRWQKNDIL